MFYISQWITISICSEVISIFQTALRRRTVEILILQPCVSCRCASRYQQFIEQRKTGWLLPFPLVVDRMLWALRTDSSVLLTIWQLSYTFFSLLSAGQRTDAVDRSYRSHKRMAEGAANPFFQRKESARAAHHRFRNSLEGKLWR